MADDCDWVITVYKGPTVVCCLLIKENSSKQPCTGAPASKTYATWCMLQVSCNVLDLI